MSGSSGKTMVKGINRDPKLRIEIESEIE